MCLYLLQVLHCYLLQKSHHLSGQHLLLFLYVCFINILFCSLSIMQIDSISLFEIWIRCKPVSSIWIFICQYLSLVCGKKCNTLIKTIGYMFSVNFAIFYYLLHFNFTDTVCKSSNVNGRLFTVVSNSTGVWHIFPHIDFWLPTSNSWIVLNGMMGAINTSSNGDTSKSLVLLEILFYF